MAENTEIAALIKLLHDDDPQVVEIVAQNIVAQGKAVVPVLEKAWEQSVNSLFQERIEQLVHQIHFNSLESELHAWTYNSSHDLLQGVYLLARYAFPELQLEELKTGIDKIVEQARAAQVTQGSALEKIRALNHVLFTVMGFSQNSQNFYAPQNSFFNIVLEQKKGNPISLAVLYMLVARAIDLPLYGVNLPKNFILVYSTHEPEQQPQPEKIEFYINPYNRGAVLSGREIEFFAKQQKLPHRSEHYLPCSHPVIVRRMLQNLVFAYQQQKNEQRTRDFERLRTILDRYLDTDAGLLN